MQRGREAGWERSASTGLWRKATAALTGAALVVFTAACSGVQYLKEKPKLDFHSIDVSGLSLTGADLILRFDIENPNDKDVKVDRVNYKLSLGGRELGSGNITQPFEIGEKSRKVVDFPVRIRYSELMHIVQELAENKGAEFALVGNVKSGPFDLPFEEKGEFELPLPPGIPPSPAINGR